MRFTTSPFLPNLAYRQTTPPQGGMCHADTLSYGHLVSVSSLNIPAKGDRQQLICNTNKHFVKAVGPSLRLRITLFHSRSTDPPLGTGCYSTKIQAQGTRRCTAHLFTQPEFLNQLIPNKRVLVSCNALTHHRGNKFDRPRRWKLLDQQALRFSFAPTSFRLRLVAPPPPPRKKRHQGLASMVARVAY